MKSLIALVLFYIVASFILAGALDTDYDDALSPSNSTNNTDNKVKETYPALAVKLNCSKLVVNHKGVKIEEKVYDSIFKPTSAPPITTTVPLKANVFTLAETTKGHEHFTTSTESFNSPIQPFHFDYTDSSILSEFLEFPDDNNPKTQTVTEEVIYANGDDLLDRKENEDNKIVRSNHSTSGPQNNITIPDCVFTFNDTGNKYHWYQIISQSGGVPGKVNATRLTPNVTVVLEPCHRPVNNTSPPLEDLLYEYESIEFKKFYRREKAFLRFAGTPSEFIDIIGQLVWAPPGQDLKFYRLSYRKDDTGFYVHVRPGQKCVFEKDPLRVNCFLAQDLDKCFDTRSLSPALLATLAGGG